MGRRPSRIRKGEGHFLKCSWPQPRRHQLGLNYLFLIGKTVAGAKLDDMVGIGWRGRLRKQGQSPGNHAVMMADTAVVMMQHQLHAAFASLHSNFMIRIERAKQRRRTNPHR